MKRVFLILSLLLFPLCFSFAKSSSKEEGFVDFFQYIDLTESQKNRILDIKYEEERAIMPYVLEICAKEEGIELLKNSKCSIIDRKCKQKLKEDIEEKEKEQDAALVKIERKKRYYEIKYKNVLTRKQLLEYEKLKNIAQEKEKNEKKAKRYEKIKAVIEKAKFIKNKDGKRLDERFPEIKYINPRGVETGF